MCKFNFGSIEATFEFDLPSASRDRRGATGPVIRATRPGEDWEAWSGAETRVRVKKVGLDVKKVLDEKLRTGETRRITASNELFDSVEAGSESIEHVLEVHIVAAAARSPARSAATPKRLFFAD